jgi:RNA polymerase sigma-70 factor (sigma-E family)
VQTLGHAQEQALTGAGVTMVDRTRPRDEEFAAYMQARQPSLLRTAYLLTGDRHTAEDLVQTALAKLYLSWDKVQQRDSIDGYVRRILVNENNSMWRRGWKKREYATGDLPDDDHVTDEYDEGQRAAVWQVVQTLPRKARAVVVLRYYEQLSEAETAEALGISVGTVKSQASRALAALRERAPQHLNPLNQEEER